MDKGNPAADPPKKDPPPVEESRYNFPPCTTRPIQTQSPLSGDTWLGFNPLRMKREVALAWVQLQVENVYASIDQEIQALLDAEKKKGLGGKIRGLFH